MCNIQDAGGSNSEGISDHGKSIDVQYICVQSAKVDFAGVSTNQADRDGGKLRRKRAKYARSQADGEAMAIDYLH